MGIEQSLKVIELDHYRMMARTTTICTEIICVTYPDQQFLS